MKVHRPSQSFIDYHSTDMQLTCDESSDHSPNRIRYDIRHRWKTAITEDLIELTANRQERGQYGSLYDSTFAHM